MNTFSTKILVLKRQNHGEADRILTVFSPEFGKFSCIAKGVRKITSTKRSALEPGMYSKVFCIRSHGFIILTQALLIEHFLESRSTLKTVKSMTQILEILEAVTVEGDGQEHIFAKAIQALQTVSVGNGSTQQKKITSILHDILHELGFQPFSKTPCASITEYVEFITEKQLKSFQYLTVQKN